MSAATVGFSPVQDPNDRGVPEIRPSTHASPDLQAPDDLFLSLDVGELHVGGQVDDIEPTVGDGRLAAAHCVLECEPGGDARRGPALTALLIETVGCLLRLERALRVALPEAGEREALAPLRRIGDGERRAEFVGSRPPVAVSQGRFGGREIVRCNAALQSTSAHERRLIT